MRVYYDRDADLNLIKDHIVLVGTSAPGLMDLRMSPQGRIMSGVEAHAQALEQVLLGHFLTRPTWAVGSEATVLVLGGLAVGVIALSAPAWVSALFTLALLGAGWLASLLPGWRAYRVSLADGLTPPA